MDNIQKISLIFIFLALILCGMILHRAFRPGNNITQFLFSLTYQGRELGEIDDGMYADMSLTAVKDQYSLLSDWHLNRYKAMIHYHYYLKNMCNITGSLSDELSNYCVLKYQARLMLERLGFRRLRIKKENYLENMALTIEKDGKKREKISYYSHFNDRVDVGLYRPEKRGEKIPALIVIPEIRFNSEKWAEDLDFYEDLGRQCAQKGYALFLFQYAGLEQALEKGDEKAVFSSVSRFYKNRLVESSKSSGLSLVVSDIFLLIHYLKKSPESFIDPKRIYMAGFGKGGSIAQIAAALEDSITRLITINGAAEFKSDPHFWDSPFMLNRMTEYNRRMGFYEYEHFKCLFSIFPRQCVINEISGKNIPFQRQSPVFTKERYQAYTWLYSALDDPGRLKINDTEFEDSMDSERIKQKLNQLILMELSSGN